jgi:hypothetical protein
MECSSSTPPLLALDGYEPSAHRPDAYSQAWNPWLLLDKRLDGPLGRSSRCGDSCILVMRN